MNGCEDFWRTRRLSRRELLRVGGIGLAGLSLPSLLRAEEARGDGQRATARSIIFLYQWGGPSHLETFDLKPEGPPDSRGEFTPIRTNVPGTYICEHLPRLANIADRYAIIRSANHTFKTHNAPAYYALTGHAPPVDDIRLRDTPDLFPAFGSVVDRLKPGPKDVPTFVAMPTVIRDGSISPGQHASFLGKAHDPLLILQDPNGADFRLPELSLPQAVSVGRLQERRELLKILDRQVRTIERSAVARGIDAYHERAFSMLSSPKVKKAFDLSQESAAQRAAYGRNTYGQCCLLARRLIEAGVRVVTVYYSRSSGGFSWDTHKDNFNELRTTLLPTTDHAVSALILDLEQRGLLAETLVVWMGEFGRTPKINADAGRDHWPGVYSLLMAGGGIRRGIVYGASDEGGHYPIERPVKPENIHGTMYHALGLDPATEVRDYLNRPFTVAGEPIYELFG
jgi:hypothetical protein